MTKTQMALAIIGIIVLIAGVATLRLALAGGDIGCAIVPDPATCAAVEELS